MTELKQQGGVKQMVLMLLDQIDDLNGQSYYLKRQLFGKKSEKLDAAQRLLFENLYDQFGNFQGCNHASQEPGRLFVPIAGTIENA